MTQVTLQFLSVIELIDFELITKNDAALSNESRLTISGKFSEADIELAKIGYHAILIDNSAPTPI